MQVAASRRAFALVGWLFWWHISFFSIEKNDSATALSQHDPVRPQDKRTSIERAARANSLDVYCDPRSELSRTRLSSDRGSRSYGWQRVGGWAQWWRVWGG